jgi:3alpha(or 20beta)-hydroxysteroid dehydrogenase
MRLSGKVAIVTGGGGSIGSEITRQFAAEGASVLVADLDESKAARVCDRLGGDTIPLRVDVADPALVHSMISTTLNRFGRLDILVNNAGIGLLRGGLHQRPLAQCRWRLSGCRHHVRSETGGRMKKRHSGFYLLLIVRFLFGAGEAGAYPNSSVSIAR